MLPSAIQANGDRRLGDRSARAAVAPRRRPPRTGSRTRRSPATRASRSATIAGRSPAAAAATSSTVAARAIAARRWNELRVATATRSESSTTPTTRPVGETHREVADPALEHVEQDLAAAAVGRHGVGGRAHHLRDRRARVDAGGDHARAQVAVGHDPQPVVAEVDDHGRRPLVGHQPRGLADRRVRRAQHERRAHQLGDRALRRVHRRLGALVARERLEQRARHVPQARPAAPAAAAPPPRGCGSRASPRPRPPRSRSAGPRASRRARTARQARAGRARGRRGRSRPRRSAPPRRARPARRPAGRSRVPAGWNSTSAASATRATSAGSSESNGGWGARKSATSCNGRDISVS